MKKQLIIFIALLLSMQLVYAQQQTELRGNVINSVTKQPVVGVLVTLRGQNQSETTDAKGEFHFVSAAAGKDMLSLSSSEIISREVPVNIQVNGVTLLKDIQVAVVEVAQNTALIGVMDEALLDDDTDGSSQEISSMVILSNDVYLNNVGYQLSPLRFKVRGYDNYYEHKYINGVAFNDQLRGVFNFAAIGALNDVTRNGDAVNYHNPSSFTFGSIGGTENINMRAGSFAKGTKITLSYTNRNYYLRGMATYSTGLQDNGWAFTASVGGRYSYEGVVDGTFYRNFSYALALEKQINGGEHSISFTTFGSPVKRGQQGASTQEAYNLLDNNLYNPNWGYQNGKRRNSRVVTAYDPTAILSHIWKIKENVTLTSGIGAHYGRYGGTALNWYNAADPRPDYYRNLPSYHTNSDLWGTDTEDGKSLQYQYNFRTDLWSSGDSKTTQIDWDELYNRNYRYKTYKPDEYEKNGALYMVEERRSDLFELSFNSTLNVILKDNHKVTTGIGLRHSESKQFKTVEDLLGADFLLDKDKYAERDEPGNTNYMQSDLNRPNRRVYEGDTFGYDFRIYMHSANVWIQDQFTTRNLDLYYGFKLTYTDFQRKGKMRNGRYENDSYGKGKMHSFVDMAVKGGFTYKFDGRNFLTGNVSYATEAPLPNNAYVSPRIADFAAEGLESGKVFSADLNYIFSYASLKGRVSVFRTNFYDQMKRNSYYHDVERTYVNHILTNLNKVNQGFELGLSYRLNTNWSFDFIGTIAEYYYANNPDGTMSSENGKINNKPETVYLKNYYVGATPQIAGVFGVNYFYDYWFLGLNVNAFGRNYIDIAPIRRQASNYETVDPTNPEQLEAYNDLVDQERFGSGYTVDFSIGKVFYLPGTQSVNLNFSFNNIFNRKNVKTGGYEQGRIDTSYPGKFGSKYYYMQGFNCYLNASYRF